MPKTRKTKSAKEPHFSPSGNDLTQIRWMLSLTPGERLEALQSAIDSLWNLRNGKPIESESKVKNRINGVYRMAQVITATFDGKVFHPEQPVVLGKNARCCLSVTLLPPEEIQNKGSARQRNRPKSASMSKRRSRK